MFWVIIVAVGLAALLIGMWAQKEYHKRKRAEFAEDAQALGFEFFIDLPEKDWANFQRFELYSLGGDSQKVRYAVVGETDTSRITVCEYEYPFNDENTETSTLLLVQDGRLNIPYFSLIERIWLLTLFGSEGIQFPEDPEFNFHLLVRGESTETIREFLTSKRRKMFLSNSINYFEGFGDCFIVKLRGVRFNPSDVKNRFEQSLRILSRLL
ncbi:MAG: hypothetical protein ACKN82_09840 [Pirellula sp.]